MVDYQTYFILMYGISEVLKKKKKQQRKPNKTKNRGQKTMTRTKLWIL